MINNIENQFREQAKDRYVNKKLATTIGKQVAEFVLAHMKELIAPRADKEKVLRELERHIRNGSPLFKTVFGVDLEPRDILCFRSEKRDNDHQKNIIPFCTIYDSDEIETGLSDSLDLNKELLQVFRSVRDAINNNSNSKDKSYSKHLVIPLFKYTENDPVLYIRGVRTNTLVLLVKLTCFDWVETYDNQGNENPRYHDEKLIVTLPINDFNNFYAVDLSVDQELEEMPVGPYGVSENGNHHFPMMDIDDVEILKILSYTIDASELTRDNFKGMFEDKKIIRGRASFQADGEIITDCVTYDYMIKCSETLQVLRMLTLLYLGEDFESYQKLFNAYKSGVLNRWCDENACEQAALDIIINHLKIQHETELGKYIEYLCNQGSWLRAYRNEDGVLIPPKLFCTKEYKPGDKYYNKKYVGELYRWIKQLHEDTKLFENEELYNMMKRIIEKNI